MFIIATILRKWSAQYIQGHFWALKIFFAQFLFQNFFLFQSISCIMVIIFIRLNAQNHVFWHAAVVETFHVAHIGRGQHPVLLHWNFSLLLTPQITFSRPRGSATKKVKSQLLLSLSPLSKKSCSCCHNVQKDRRKATAALAQANTTQFFAWTTYLLGTTFGCFRNSTYLAAAKMNWLTQI